MDEPEAGNEEMRRSAGQNEFTIVRQPLPKRSKKGSPASESGWDVWVCKAGTARCVRSEGADESVVYSYALGDSDVLELALTGRPQECHLILHQKGAIARRDTLSQILRPKGTLDPIILNLLRYNMPWEETKAILGPDLEERGSGDLLLSWRLSGGGEIMLSHVRKVRGLEEDSIIVTREGLDFPADLQRCYDDGEE